ncbi:hypothetical protein GCM10023115_35150 [Pontixanthobacter gangjinensis]|uniref:Porin family protein n=1 Tax=Christiangramia aestuarii TaxID=1028746 RepID=A0A7K1LR95_9FLAO|nr:hypothetical protein [Christiangramia aestuarii]MUP43316.1 hypothetical protein [Christiangramia aestuarii]
MRLNFKLFLCFILIPLILSAQEETQVDLKNYEQEDPETVFFNIGLYKPLAFGDNSFHKAYATADTGLEIDFNWLAFSDFTVGFKLDIFYASVDDISKVGAINGTRVTNYSIHAGYYKAITREWNWHASLGVGSVGYRSSTYDDIIREYGWNLYFQNELNYRFNQYFGIFGKVQLRADFLDIETARPKDDFLNNQWFLIPGIGIRINFHNPEG